MASHSLRTTLVVLAFLVAACTPYLGITNTTNVTFTNVSQSTGTPVETEQTPPVEQAQEQFAARLTFTEGDLIKLKTLAVDPDKDKVTLEFSEPFNKEGIWQTTIGDAGDYPVTVIARDSKGAETTQKLLVTIKYANRAPSIDGADTLAVKEGETITLDYTATDLDGDEVIMSYSGWIKSKEYTTTFDDAGEHIVTIIAEDGKLTTKKIVKISVENVNRAPEIVLTTDSYETTELIPITIKPKVTDADENKVTVTFSAPLDEEGSWTPALDQAGDYEVTITASDGTDTTTKIVKITVKRTNRAPNIMVPTDDGEVYVKENEFIDLKNILTITDPEGEPVTVTYSGWMRSSTYRTTYDDAGKYVVSVTATDDSGHIITKDVTINIENVNRPPVFTVPA